MEIWKPTKYEHYYVSNLGNVKSVYDGVEKILKAVPQGKAPSLYKGVTIHFGHHVQKSVKVHRLVAETFLPNPNNWKCVNHKNGIKTDNRVENLEWCTYRINNIHSRLVLKNKKLGKRVKCLETGDVFESCAYCESIIGRASGSIGKCLSGKLKTCARYHWIQTDEEPTKNIDVTKYKNKKYSDVARNMGVNKDVFYGRRHRGWAMSEMWRKPNTRKRITKGE